MARFQLADVAERSRRGGDVAQLDVRIQCLPVELARRQPGGVQGLELGGEGDPPIAGDDVERLDPEPVARQDERLGGGVPDCVGEHTAQPIDAGGALLLIEVQHCLRIARRAERVSAGDEAVAELPVIVDLAVENDRLGAVLIEDRLVATAQIDDAETPHTQPHGAAHVQPFVVGTAVLECGTHPAH